MIMKNHRDLQKMVIQVSEVLPHVPRDVIFRDLGNVNLVATIFVFSHLLVQNVNFSIL